MTSLDEVEAAAFRNENTIEIAAPPDRVWPWLVQMGFGRAGWYSWDLIDNLGRRSATELHPEWMIRQAGEPVPGGPIEFDTPVVDEPEHFVIAFGPRRLLLWNVEFVLSYRLVATKAGSTLTSVATARIDGPLGSQFARWFLGPGDDVMVRKQLRGIRERAEALALADAA